MQLDLLSQSVKISKIIFRLLLSCCHQKACLFVHLLEKSIQFWKAAENANMKFLRLIIGEKKFLHRRGQLIFVPERDHDFLQYGLDILSSGRFVTSLTTVRHLKVFCFKNNNSIRDSRLICSHNAN